LDFLVLIFTQLLLVFGPASYGIALIRGKSLTRSHWKMNHEAMDEQIKDYRLMLALPQYGGVCNSIFARGLADLACNKVCSA
jgi:hypothetical protein